MSNVANFSATSRANHFDAIDQLSNAHACYRALGQIVSSFRGELSLLDAEDFSSLMLLIEKELEIGIQMLSSDSPSERKVVNE